MNFAVVTAVLKKRRGSALRLVLPDSCSARNHGHSALDKAQCDFSDQCHNDNNSARNHCHGVSDKVQRDATESVA